ncbi:MAG: DUF6514 family protein [Eubacteriales bacterium]
MYTSSPVEQTQITYRIVKTASKTHGSEGEPVYGVEVKITGEQNYYASIDDITTDRSVIEELIYRLKKAGLHLISFFILSKIILRK